MNETAKKLRDITQNAGVTTGSGKPYSVIATIKSAFGFDSMLAPGVLLQFMAAIADEMDELQAEANDANNLRQKLDSAGKKAERRKQHIGYLETALHDKNALLEQRGGTIARLTAECSGLRKQVPSERERRILDMWPRFEDGECVWFGDRYEDWDGWKKEVAAVQFERNESSLLDCDGFHTCFSLSERVKRPAPKVLDADGVEIKVGDTVWTLDGLEGVVTKVEDGAAYIAYESDYAQCEEAANLTHARPDSWERLEEDAEFNDETGIVGGNLDIVRRAKALAGVGVD